MKKYLMTLVIMCGLLISSNALPQMDRWGGGGQMRSPMNQQMTPPSFSLATLSPDSQLLYVVNEDKLYQYTASKLELRKTAFIGGQPSTGGNSQSGTLEMRGSEMSGPGSLFTSHDGKYLYVVRGQTVYLFDALELNYISKVSF